MIYAVDGAAPLAEALTLAGMRASERRAYRRPTNYVLDPASNDPLRRAYRIAYTKHGDPLRIFRAAHRRQPGRGYLERQRRAQTEMREAAQ